MTVPALSSLLVGTADARRLRAWYVAALAPGDAGDRVVEVTPTMFACTFGSTTLLIDGRGDVADKNGEPNRLILNFVVDDIAVVEARLVAMEAVWVREVERTPWGMIGTVLDVDGNYVQIIEPAPGTVPWCAKGGEEEGV
jgi:Glyoxalase-like domain